MAQEANEKLAAMKGFEQSLKSSGNLSADEVNTLVAFEFVTGPKTIEDQVSRYHLKIKVEDPQKAKEFVAKVEGITEPRALSVSVAEFIDGAVIRSEDGVTYSSGMPISEID